MSEIWLPGLERLDAYWCVDDQRWAQPFAEGMPDLLVIHSAAQGNWPAEWLHNPVTKDPDKGRLCKDGKRRIVAGAHLCFYEGRTAKLRAGWLDRAPTPGTFVQMGDLAREAPGAGGPTSRCQGRRGVNPRAVHVELPAAPGNVAVVRALFHDALGKLLVARPTITLWTMHRVTDPANKTDPVPTSGFSADWMDGFGLTFAPR